MLIAVILCLVLVLVVVGQKYRQTANEDLWLGRLRDVAQEFGDSILMIDDRGKIWFLNRSAQKLFSYSEKEVVGKPYHILLQQEAGKLIEEMLRSGEKLEQKRLTFTTAAGVEFEADLRALPFISTGDSEGLLCIIRSRQRIIGDSASREQDARDALTGLFNRKFFDVELERLDSPENWPLSILIGDLNGLKLTNDIFGHSTGDELLVTVAQVLREVFRPQDRIFRWGGDEFVVLLPKTSHAEAIELQELLAESLDAKSMGPIKIYMPLGHATKEQAEQDIEMIWQQAEEQMYWHKTVTHSSFLKETLANVVKELHKRNTGEKEHAERVSLLAEEFGSYLKLTATQLRRVRLAGFLHDVGKVALDPELLYRPYPLKTAEQYEMRRHPLVGFRLLNFFDDTLDIAGSVLAHHEHWDGGGYPKGLKGEEIPYLGRILAIIETYDRILYDPHTDKSHPEAALEFIERAGGTKFDPELCAAFVQMMRTKLACEAAALQNEVC